MSGTYYITNVYLGYWPITRPKRSKEKSVYAAQNQVCMALLADRGVTPPPQYEIQNMAVQGIRLCIVGRSQAVHRGYHRGDSRGPETEGVQGEILHSLLRPP